jgi:hypothetical protein
MIENVTIQKEIVRFHRKPASPHRDDVAVLHQPLLAAESKTNCQRVCADWQSEAAASVT